MVAHFSTASHDVYSAKYPKRGVCVHMSQPRNVGRLFVVQMYVQGSEFARYKQPAHERTAAGAVTVIKYSYCRSHDFGKGVYSTYYGRLYSRAKSARVYAPGTILADRPWESLTHVLCVSRTAGREDSVAFTLSELPTV